MSKIKFLKLSTDDAGQMIRRLMARCVRDEKTGCVEWIGSVGSSGYGKLRLGRYQDYSVHRVAWTVAHGEIPAGLCVLHSCDNRRCVNPEHLFLGTYSDNAKDATRKGRMVSPARSRTHCPKGHPYSGVNSMGRRICRTCQSAATLRHYHRTKKLRGHSHV